MRRDDPPIHFNEPGRVHKRHQRRSGFEKSHHLEHKPSDEPWSLPGGVPWAGDGIGTPEVGVTCTQGDIRCFLFDDFERSYTVPSTTDGAALSGTLYHIWESVGKDGTYEGVVWVQWTSPLKNNRIESYVGTGYYTHTSRPEWSTCGGLDNTFAGWKERSTVRHYDVSSVPTDAAGVQITASGNGGATPAQASVLVSTSQPSSPRDGVQVGVVSTGGAATTVFIPYSYFAGSDDLYVILAPGWEAEKDFGHYCGFNWSWNTNIHNSAVGDYGITAAKWLIFASGDTDLGVTPVTVEPREGGPSWDGGHRLQFLGTTGSPSSYGLDGSLFLTATNSATLTVGYQGETEDEGTLESPWDFPGWAYKFEFMVDEAGNTGVAGERSLTFSDGSSGVVAKVYLGSSDHASGISISSGGTEVFEAFTFAADTRYGVRVDTRAGEARARVWAVGDGETGKWLVVTPISDEGDRSDFFEITLAAGNGGANPAQTIYLYPWVACGYADECYWVDEFLGVGDGETRTFYTSQRYARSSLQARFDGLWVEVDEAEPYAGRFVTDHPPADGAFIWARYLIGTEYDEGDD